MEYRIEETIPKKDGTRVWCINLITGYLPMGYTQMPIMEEIFRGTKEECEKELEELKKVGK